jgi:enoyl-CoA hydratase/carnithine racemase
MPAAAHLSYPVDGVGLIVIDSPPRNFGTPELFARIGEALLQAEEAGCGAVVLASDTPGYWIAHWSLQNLVDAYSRPPGSGAARPGRRQLGLFDLLETIPMVSIAANNGQAWGGGSELSWACDLRIAGESATYGQPEVALGIIPGAGGTTRLARLVGQTKCTEMVLDCRPIMAREALTVGAINRVVPDDSLRDEAIAWAARIAKMPRWALAAAKRSLIEGRDLPLAAARRNESLIFADISRRPDALETMRAAQARYDAGADSYEAIGIERRA